MFQNNSFVRVRRRGAETMLLQFVLLASLFFFSLIGVVAFMHFSNPQPKPSQASVATTDASSIEILVPIENVEAGVALEASMFRRDQRPAAVVGPEVIRNVDEVQGLYSRGVLVAGQPIHKDFLTNLQPVNALTASIPTGYRAIALQVDATSSVEGWAQPGARVDVFWITEYTGKRTASIIAPNAKVLSANRKTEGADNNDPRTAAQDKQIPSTVTLLLTTRDSLRVRLASLHGRLSLVLRGSQDAGAAASGAPINEGNLYSAINHGPAPAPRNLVTVKVKDRANGTEEQLTFENGQRVEE